MKCEWIREPRWHRPALTAAGQVITVRSSALLPDDCTFTLQRDSVDVQLARAGSVFTHGSNTFCIDINVPGDCTTGLWDLYLRRGSEEVCLPHAVAVRDPAVEAMTIACIGDWHFLPSDLDAPVEHTGQRFRRLVTHLNALGPDLVVHVGDVITRYDRDKQPRPDALIHWQMKEAAAILQELETPVLVLPGNHDLAYPSCRAAWKDAFGESADAAIESTARQLGVCNLLTIAGFAYIDPESLEVLEASLTDEQMNWLEAQCRGEKLERWRILVLHYDYAEQVITRLRELGIDALVYGHAGSVGEKWFAGTGARDALVPHGEAYRLITVTQDRLDIAQPVSFDDL